VSRPLAAVGALVWREVIRFLRDRNRVFGALLQPIIFWALFGSGLRASFHPPVPGGSVSYEEYFFPGVVVMVLLFTAIFSTVSLIEDRREGFLQSVLVAPVPRSIVVLGKVLGGTVLAMGQGLVILALAPLAGIRLMPAVLGESCLVLAPLSFGLTALSFCVAWRMESTQGFHAVMTVFLMPLWLLSGAPFPSLGAPAWLRALIALNPVTYGLAAFRRVLYPAHAPIVQGLPSTGLSILVTLLFCAVSFGAALGLAVRTGTRAPA
jgi:ABC-2 type transport system permease protein